MLTGTLAGEGFTLPYPHIIPACQTTRLDHQDLPRGRDSLTLSGSLVTHSPLTFHPLHNNSHHPPPPGPPARKNQECDPTRLHLDPQLKLVVLQSGSLQQPFAPIITHRSVTLRRAWAAGTIVLR